MKGRGPVVKSHAWNTFLKHFQRNKKKKKERKAFITKKQNKNKNVYSFKGF